MAILFADSFNGYNHGGQLGRYVGDKIDGLVSAGYEVPTDLAASGSAGRAAAVMTNAGKNRNAVRLCWQNRFSQEYVAAAYIPEPPVGLKRLFNYDWRRFVVLGTSFRLRKYDAYRILDPNIPENKIPFLFFGPIAVYLNNQVDQLTGRECWDVFVNGSTQSSVRIFDNDWMHLELEVNREEGKLRLWVNSYAVWQADSTNFDVDGLEFIGVGKAASGIWMPIGYADIDCIVINDGSGTANNTRLGRIGVSCLSPQANVKAEFAPVGGTTNFSNVSGTVNNNHTFTFASYVQSDVVGAIDQYGFTAEPAVVPKAVMVVTVAKMSEPNTYGVAPLITFDGQEIQGQAIELKAAVWLCDHWMLNTDPSGAAWTKEKLASLNWGQKLLEVSAGDVLVNGGYDYLLFGSHGTTIDSYRTPDPTYDDPNTSPAPEPEPEPVVTNEESTIVAQYTFEESSEDSVTETEAQLQESESVSDGNLNMG